MAMITPMFDCKILISSQLILFIRERVKVDNFTQNFEIDIKYNTKNFDSILIIYIFNLIIFKH